VAATDYICTNFGVDSTDTWTQTDTHTQSQTQLITHTLHPTPTF